MESWATRYCPGMSTVNETRAMVSRDEVDEEEDPVEVGRDRVSVRKSSEWRRKKVEEGGV